MATQPRRTRHAAKSAIPAAAERRLHDEGPNALNCASKLRSVEVTR